MIAGNCNSCGALMRLTLDDAGPFHCDACERLATETAHALLDSAALKLENALNERNAAHYRAMDAETRHAIVCKAIESGHFYWRIS